MLAHDSTDLSVGAFVCGVTQLCNNSVSGDGSSSGGGGVSRALRQLVDGKLTLPMPLPPPVPATQRRDECEVELKWGVDATGVVTSEPSLLPPPPPPPPAATSGAVTEQEEQQKKGKEREAEEWIAESLLLSAYECERFQSWAHTRLQRAGASASASAPATSTQPLVFWSAVRERLLDLYLMRLVKDAAPSTAVGVTYSFALDFVS